MNLEWMLIRGTGLVAYALLAASTIWGLMVSSKVMGRLVKAKPLTWLHEGLAVGALLATAAHMFFLWTDDFIEFGPRELFIPGASTWEPLSVAFGIVAFYVAFIVSASFYIKKWIGQAAWRAIHFLAFGTFAAAAAHGIMAGTDTQHPAVLAMYVGTIAIVLMLVMIRGAQEAVPPAAEPPTPASSRVRRHQAGEQDQRHAAPSEPGAADPTVEERLAALRARRGTRPASEPESSPATPAEPATEAASSAVTPEMEARLAALAARRSGPRSD